MELHQPTTIRELYPDFNHEQLQKAEANLERFLAVVMRIAERLRAEDFDMSSPDLTASETEASIPHVKVEPSTPLSQPKAQP